MNDINPPAETRPAESVKELTALARREYQAGEAATGKGLEHYRRAGEALAKLKKAVGHGNFLKALEGAGIPQQRASECVRLFTFWAKVPPGGTLKGSLEAVTKLTVAEVVSRLPHEPPPGPPKTVSGDVKITEGPRPPGGVVVRRSDAPPLFPPKPPPKAAPPEDEPARPAADGRAAAGRGVPFSLVGTPGLRGTPAKTALLRDAAKELRAVRAKWAAYEIPELQETLDAIDRLPREVG
jgi:hypothetical protein